MSDYYDDDIDNYWSSPKTPNGLKGRKIAYDSSKHYPNSDEAQVLRRIMSETGLSEEEVRADVKYRKMLAEARLAGQKQKRDRVEKYYHSVIKKACRQTGLAKEHPETLKIIAQILNDDYRNPFRTSYYYRSRGLSAQQVVEYYGKTYR